jgi:hypothetical protein
MESGNYLPGTVIHEASVGTLEFIERSQKLNHRLNRSPLKLGLSPVWGSA